ncbi:helix-turn-helix transcriptional regulator [Labrenzia sp. PO1]|nr:helix-turn-helix transcriptional regulator [Labrenzia sp. PO1]
MKLNDFLGDNQMSHAEFGGRVGVSQAAISRYANGLRWPKPEIISLIETATGGQVTVKDHYDAYQGARITKKAAA